MLNQIKVVLVETSHPGNVGACARAMKNMGLSRLVLVNSTVHLKAEAISRASGASDILEQAQVVKTLDEALVGCHYVMGTSARLRNADIPIAEPRACAKMLKSHAQKGTVAVLFGRERTGLSNDEMDRCQQLVHIPTNEQYSSLNLGMAVQVIAYEIFIAYQMDMPLDTVRDIAPAEEMAGFYQHLEQMLTDVGFTDNRQSEKLHRRLRRIFFRAELDKVELQLLRGILSAAQGRKSMK